MTVNDHSEQRKVALKHLRRLDEAARVAVETSLKVGEGERVLIVTNPPIESYGIALALHNAVADAGGIPIFMIQPVKRQLDFADEAVIQALASQPEVCISISTQKIGKDRSAINKPYLFEGRRYDHIFTYLMASGKTRAFWSPAATQDMFIRTVPIDYGRLRREVQAVKMVLDRADEVRVESPAGTDLIIGLKNRTAFVDDGDLSKAGAGGNLPAGEAFISPELGSSSGRIVFDGSIALTEGDRIVSEPVTVDVENGFAVRIEGGQDAEMLEQSIRFGEDKARKFEQEGRLSPDKGKQYRRNARNLGELGIGLNPAAVISGHMLEDEKAYRTCHIAIGSNYDEDAPALIHLDCLMRGPTITARTTDGDEECILKDGELNSGLLLNLPGS
ncbi:MAG: aminopeptidase [Sediminispirochaetaceae bacterium]